MFDSISKTTLPFENSLQVSLDKWALLVTLTDVPALWGRLLPLQQGTFVIGRDEQASLSINSAEVSRRHATIEVHDDGLFLNDLGSKNGTYQNNERITVSRKINAGDVITIARTSLLCVPVHSALTHAENIRKNPILPFPLAVLQPLCASQPAPLDRVRLLSDALHLSLRFLTAAMIGALTRDQRDLSALIHILRHILSEGAPWGTAAFQLGALFPLKSTLATLGKNLQKSVVYGDSLFDAAIHAHDLSRWISGQGILASSACSDEEPYLAEALNMVVRASEPLTASTLFSVDRVIGFDTHAIRYATYDHRGPCEHFPIRHIKRRAQLMNDWCYLELPERREAPIPLAPLVRYGTCSRCGRRELAISEELMFGPAGQCTKVRGVASSHISDALIPRESRMDALFQSLREKPGEKRSERPFIPTLPPPPFPSDEESSAAVLFIAANPKDSFESIDKGIDEEFRAIDNAAQSGPENKIRLIPKLAVRGDELLTILMRHKAQIIHFSGHGSTTGQIYLQDNDGQSFPLSPEEFARILSVLPAKPICLVLSACYSAMAADAIRPHVRTLIGMKSDIGVDAAVGFAAAFYGALAAGSTIKTSFEAGCSQASLEHGQASDVLELYVNDDTDPSALRLVLPRRDTEH